MSRCANERCERGWITVTAAYVDEHAPKRPTAEVWDGMTDAERAAWEAQDEAVRAGLAATVYPCKQCEPEMFYRWAGGHLDPRHNRADCDECSTPRSRRRTRSTAGPDPEPVPDPAWAGRRDLS